MSTPPCDHSLKFVGNRKVEEWVAGPLGGYWATTYHGHYRCGTCGFGVLRDAVLDDFQHDLLDK